MSDLEDYMAELRETHGRLSKVEAVLMEEFSSMGQRVAASFAMGVVFLMLAVENGEFSAEEAWAYYMQVAKRLGVRLRRGLDEIVED